MTNNQTLLTRSNGHSHAGRVSVPASYKASITVEASLAIPIFVFAVVCLLYLLEIMAIQTAVRSGLQYAGKVIAVESKEIPVLLPAEVEQEVVNAIGTARLERSTIVNGCAGIDCSKSYLSARTGIGELRAEYQVQIPVPFFHINRITLKEAIKIKVWDGYKKEGISFDKDEIVYITETGLVYHKDYYCTYLDLSIRMVTRDYIDELRNSNGGKYYPCGFCTSYGGVGVYITSSGNRYHNSLSCSGLKRTVYAVPLSEARGKGVCSRCGK